MKSKFLKLMQCPFCGSIFTLQEIIEKKDEEVITGIVKCECSEFPVLEGILVIKASPLNGRIVNLIKERRILEATIHCFGWEDFENLYESYVPFRFIKKIQWALGRFLFHLGYAELMKINKFFFKAYSDKNLPFINVLGKSGFDMYLRNRFSCETFWSIYPFIPLLKKKNSIILDLGCGAGHGSFVLSKYVEPQIHCCADSSFQLLYLARKYFAQSAEFVCLDANSPLPFRDQIFSTILMPDAFHYVNERANLAREMKRALLTGGLILLPHLHNSLAYGRDARAIGHPLSPQTYTNLFESEELEVKIMPERRIVENFLFCNSLDLAKKYSESEINSAFAMILIATSDESLIKVYDEVNRDFLSLKNNLVINPLYEMKPKDNSILLERSSNKFSLLYEDHYPLTESYIPEKFEIDREFVCGRKVHISDLEKAEDLMKRFVIINVPENYLE